MLNRFFSWLEGLRPPFPDLAPERPPETLQAFILYFAKPFWPLLLACSAVAATVALLEVSLFAFLGNLVNWLANADRSTFWENRGSIIIAMAILVIVVLPLLKLFYESIVHQGLNANFAMRARWLSHRYVLRQSMEFFQDDFAGRLSAKVMQTAVAVREIVLKITEVFVYVGVYFLGAVVTFGANDLRLVAPLLLWLVGYFAAMRYFVPRIGEISARQADARSLMTGRVVDSYTNIATVKLFAHAAREDSYAREGMGGFLDTVYEQMRWVTLLTVALNTLNALLLTSTTALALWLWHKGQVEAGAIALAMGLIMRMQGMSHWIMWEIAGLFEQIGIARDGMNSIARRQTVVDLPDATELQVSEGKIEYQSITFDYAKPRNDVARGVIEDLSLTIAAGEKVGLVGRSGAGKSTMASLLLRFHDLESGRIAIDGQDIAVVQQESLRSQIAMVTQDTSLLHRSVHDNIVYGRPDATRADAVKAAKLAQAHDFIKGLEDAKGRKGYDAHVGERGVKLSGGQRQRIAIARVLLKDAPILVLDEATSALDSEVEAAIQDQLINLMQGKTVIAIAHRLSTIAHMDRLVIMDEGKIVEHGDHASLLKRGGIYSDLWARQSGGFLAREAAE
ncbi:MAG: ABC transporter ATP-binding protein/permease [Alphaproteobacteria bacterium]|nr:ABC transporter ATP-binding protein/permease [Alphaproteobacteria bacterium]